MKKVYYQPEIEVSILEPMTTLCDSAMYGGGGTGTGD